MAAGTGLGLVDGRPLAVFQAQDLRGQRELPRHSRVPDRLALTVFVPQLVLLPQPGARRRPGRTAPCALNGQLPDASSTRDADLAESL